MRLSKQDVILLSTALAIVCTGVGLAFIKGKKPKIENPGLTSQELFPEEIDSNEPKLVRFKGDLALGGLINGDGKIDPFVVGESLNLEVLAEHTTKYSWTCNDQPVLIKGNKEGKWTTDPNRTYPVNKPGQYLFRVQGKSGKKITQTLEKAIQILPVKIGTFEPDLIPLSVQERYLTHDSISLLTEMVLPMNEVPYLFRYSINGSVLKHPRDQKEWTSSDDLFYTFKKPGVYNFSVEVRRATSTKVEDQKSLPVPIRVGDSIIEYFDLTPPQNALTGTKILLDAILNSVSGYCECRMGIRDLSDPEGKFQWLPSANGQEWGSDQRVWIPAKAGVYRVRVEVRTSGQEKFDDFWEVSDFTIVEARGKDDF